MSTPQRVDPKKPGPRALYVPDHQLDYVVVFDGTARAPLGPQLFVATETRQTAAPDLRHDARIRRPAVPVTADAQARVLYHLSCDDYTIAELARLGHITEDVARNAVLRLRHAGEVCVVTSRPNPLAGQKGQRRWLNVYGVRA